MQPISKYIQIMNTMHNKNIHILFTSFEERCNGYPSFISKNLDYFQNPLIFCCEIPNDNVSEFLKSLKKQNYENIKSTLHTIQFIKFEELENTINSFPQGIFYYVDISGIPRKYIFILLDLFYNKIKGDNDSKVHFIYTYPNEYVFTSLQDPDTRLDCFYHSPMFVPNIESTVLIFPGFDIEFTNIALTYLKWPNESINIQWFISFPGKKYEFYERSLKNHIEFIHNEKIHLFPFQNILRSSNIIMEAINTEANRPIFIIPLAPRIICLPIYLALIKAKQKEKKINILLPRTRKYHSLRSIGYTSDSFIEEFDFKS